MSIANQEGNSGLTDVALGLVKFTSSLPLPPNALTALDAADKLSTSIINSVETDENTDANLAKEGGIQLDFSPDGKTMIPVGWKLAQSIGGTAVAISVSNPARTIRNWLR